MRLRAPLSLIVLTASAALIAGCQATTADAPSASPAATSAAIRGADTTARGDGHGAISGAQELAEPALHLTSVAADGVVHHLDLLDGRPETLGKIRSADSLDSEGRFLFAGRDGAVSIIDSGVWTWNHVDHFHYYEAPARLLGELKGTGTPRVVTSDLGVGVYFDGGGGGGEAVLLDFEALKKGEIVESFRLDLGSPGSFVAPVPSGALIAGAGAIRHVDVSGAPRDAVPCVDPEGSIATNVGVVIGCADAAVLAVTDTSGVAFERIPYPAGGPGRALSFSNREGRPAVAGHTGSSGFWLLDTRARSWTAHDAGEPIVRVTAVDDAEKTVVALAVDDAEKTVVALAVDGSVLVLSGATGELRARTEPLVVGSLADQRRTYLNGPAERTLFEIDPADGARVARAFVVGHAPVLFTETGR